MIKSIVFTLLIIVVGCLKCNGQQSNIGKPKGVIPDTVMGRLLFPEGDTGLTAGDGAISIPVGQHQSVWLWGDSYVGKITCGKRDSTARMVFGNVFVMLDGDNAHTSCGENPAHPQAVIPGGNIDGKVAVWWPHHGFIQDSVLHVFASNIVFGGGNMWDFSCRAIAYFRLSYPEFKVIDSIELPVYPLNQVDYGYGFYEQSGYYYFYGIKTEGYSSSLHAARARFKEGMLQDCEYFDGNGWNTDPLQTNPLDGIDVAVSSQFSVFPYKNRYILLTQEKGIGKNDIYTFVSDNPTGPWTNKKKVYSTPEPLYDKNLFAYNAMAHPQYDENGMLLVSYCLNTHQPTDKVSDYRPRFIRIPYQLIVEK